MSNEYPVAEITLGANFNPEQDQVGTLLSLAGNVFRLIDNGHAPDSHFMKVGRLLYQQLQDALNGDDVRQVCWYSFQFATWYETYVFQVRNYDEIQKMDRVRSGGGESLDVILERVREIEDSVDRSQTTLKEALRSRGISASTFHHWRRRLCDNGMY
ncbi:MAG: hypothetical protein KDA60_18120 [Planctomycetales bacterium]|nr:hypothetical protein [Planctomycetales bacterium]